LVFLFGVPGCGKSSLAGCIAYESSRRLPVVWHRASEIVLGSFHDASIVTRAKKAGILVLDDLGTENSTDYSRMILIDVICGRLDHGRPTIITSNMSKSNMEKRYSVIASRVWSVDSLQVGFPDISYRRREEH
jgi:DNA replication protein DnaC